MLTEIETQFISLGNEPIEILGFDSEEELEQALIPLMQNLDSPNPFRFHM